VLAARGVQDTWDADDAYERGGMGGTASQEAAVREAMRALLLDHMKQMKLQLLEKTAGSMGDNMKRMVAEHEQLLMELAFSSKRGEEVALLNQKLVQVRGKQCAGWGQGRALTAAAHTHSHSHTCTHTPSPM
jgi:hypothetical protein